RRTTRSRSADPGSQEWSLQPPVLGEASNSRKPKQAVKKMSNVYVQFAPYGFLHGYSRCSEQESVKVGAHDAVDEVECAFRVLWREFGGGNRLQLRKTRRQ